MEKLILRSIMYGAEKIPDSWFEKVPGGFYRPSHSNGKNNDSARQRSRGRQPSSPTRDRDGRRRRDSIGETVRSPPRDDSMFDEGYRSDGHARHRNRQDRDSYDGAENDDEDAEHRPRHASRKSGQRCDDNYGRTHNDDRYDGYNDRRMSGTQPHQHYDPQQRSFPGAALYSPGGFAAGGGGTTGTAPYPSSAPQSPGIKSPPTSTAGFSSSGYIPYAHLYGQPNQPEGPRQHYSNPGSSDHSPNSRETFRSPVAPQPWQQNVDAQQAPTAAAAGAGAEYNGQPGFINTELYEPRYDQRRPLHPDQRYGNDYIGYINDSRDPRSRRAKSQGEGRGKSRFREVRDKHFDTTKHGLGYGAIGAIAGGLLGSELEKGLVPTAIGAAVGALGANAFEARERRGREQRRNQMQHPEDIHRARRDPQRSATKEYGYYSD
ncbi:Hypothetical protein R9X50_00040100 [Acrodontium crateriforme]|uniref:Glycine zipper 2TM domain-containing protein n=1 Tax=Acrodontium crateriforme TaxID=150365 RepID=A0AAQ3LXZ5_9PEZI|nr:Hypothetical protein R9X50_00040100 [Acrodontium crateriforme]